jgi:hypothetical protein
MVGLPYDAVNSWTGQYPVAVFTIQLRKVADGFDQGLKELKQQIQAFNLTEQELRELARECSVAETVSIHCHSVANQAEFITLRDQLILSKEQPKDLERIKDILKNEISLAKRMHELQCSDTRLGYEASNHYFYTPDDLVEKVLNCRNLIDEWLPKMK